jgi:hypothetical protein
MSIFALASAVLSAADRGKLAPTDSAHIARLRAIARDSLDARYCRGAASVLVDLLAVLTWREAEVRAVPGVSGRTLDTPEMHALWAGWVDLGDLDPCDAHQRLADAR